MRDYRTPQTSCINYKIFALLRAMFILDPVAEEFIEIVQWLKQLNLVQLFYQYKDEQELQTEMNLEGEVNRVCTCKRGNNESDKAQQFSIEMDSQIDIETLADFCASAWPYD